MTLYIIMLTIAASIAGFYNPGFKDKLIFNPYDVKHRNQWYRFISCGLLHADFVHLLVNMFVLYSFGIAVERYYQLAFGEYAPVIFILLYVSSLFASNVSTFYKYRDAPAYNALGASGGVSAILFACILFNPLKPVYLYGFIQMPGILMGVLYLVYSYYMDKKQTDNVNHQAHLWGALYGVVFTIVLKPAVMKIFWYQLTGG